MADIPTTEQVREAAYEHGSTGVTYPEFDAWLESVKADAWDEGATTIQDCHKATWRCGSTGTHESHPNPYRPKETT